MIIPNKFIPMLKESALFKSRTSSNDLSDFLKPKSHEHDSVTGQTRQSLMSSLGMDSGQSQGIGAGDINGMGGMEETGGMDGTARTGGISNTGAIGEMGGRLGAGGAGEAGEMNAFGTMEETAGPGQMDRMNDQMNMMNRIGGIGNLDGTRPLLEGSMGSDGVNPLPNGAGYGVNSEGENPPAGDPIGALKDMLSAQGTNAALGTNSEAFGPGGAANSNVLAMLNQIVGKEMPSESPVDPGSKTEQLWDQLQKNFNAQKPSGVPYIDSESSKSSTNQIQQDSAVSNANYTTTKAEKSEANGSVTQVKNPLNGTLPAGKPLISNPPVTSSTSIKFTSSNPSAAHSIPQNPSATGPTTTTNSKSKPNSQNEAHTNAMTKTTSSLPEIEAEEDQPLSPDMIKFLKGVKFVISQEPGNDIILGKKFSSDAPLGSAEFKEENGVMKNVVSASKMERAIAGFKSSRQSKGCSARNFCVGRKKYGINLAGAKKTSPSNMNFLNQGEMKNKDSFVFMKAAKILRSACKKLRDPVAKKSTEIAIASILKVLALGNNKKSSSSNADLLNRGDIKNKLSEKYMEAARVLGTASKKLADKVAKKSTEIGIASILKVIALSEYPTMKKTFIPRLYRSIYDHNLHAGSYDSEEEKFEKIANGLAETIKQEMKLGKNHHQNIDKI